MNHLFLKSALLLCAIPLAYSCSDAPSASSDDLATPECPLAGIPCYYDSTSTYVLYGDGYLIKAGQNYTTTSVTTMDFIVYPDLDGMVTNADGYYMGKINGQGRAILDANNQPLVSMLDLTELEVIHPVIPPPPEEPVENPNDNPNDNPSGQKYKMLGGAAWVLHADQDYLIYSDGRVSDVNCNVVAKMDDPLMGGDIISATSGEVLVANVKTADLTIIQQSDNLACPTQPTSSATVKTSSSGTNTPTSNTTKSSSSAAPKSSSSAQPASTGSCPTIKTKGGGGSGWATRYWDCCKPSCSWNENAGGHPTKQCDAKGKNQNNDYGAQSVCSGGGAATCLSQIPFTVDGCKEMAFAFAAVPASNGGQCGKCFQLTFTGEGKYSTNANTRGIKGKKLIIMVTNIGSDVNQGQFDIMIPGGGVGQFNGCSQMGWGDQGDQYGGLLSKCEVESDYNENETRNCLERRCGSVFSNDAQAKEGCLFLANWMHAASNPTHNYVEVECPDVLKNKY